MKAVDEQTGDRERAQRRKQEVQTDSPRVVHVPVASSLVASVGYGSEAQTLEVRFCNGRTYRYFNVPVAIYESFVAASSKGFFFNDVVRGRFGYARI